MVLVFKFLFVLKFAMIVLVMSGTTLLAVDYRISEEATAIEEMIEDRESFYNANQRIEFKNISTSPFFIKEIHVDSKVCDVMDWSRDEIKPKKKGFIKLRQKRIPLKMGVSEILLEVILGFPNRSDEEKVNFEIKRIVEDD